MVGQSQVTGTKVIGVDYANLAAAITALNTSGVGAGGATIDVPAGYTETAPSGGFVLGSTVLNASLSATNPLVFQKLGAGANPVLTAFTGGTSTISDGVFKLAGTDYVTIDGVNIAENAANSGAALMEWGYAILNLNAAAPLDGCKNLTIKNCTISLNKLNPNNTFAIISKHYVPTQSSTTALVPTAVADVHSNNKFYTNDISNVGEGIWIEGNSSSTYFGQSNDVGGSSAATGNRFTNMGLATAFNTFCIYFLYQNLGNASYNTIDNALGSTPVSATDLQGIYAYGAGSTFTANGNNIKLNQVSGSATIAGIFASPLSVLNANNNTISITSLAATGSYYFINSGATVTATITGNTFNNSSILSTGSVYGVYNSATLTTATVSNNTMQNINLTGALGTFYGVYTGSPSTGTYDSNLIDGISYTNLTSTGTIYGIYDISSGVTMTYTNNIVKNLSTPTTGSLYGIREFGVSGVKTLQNNQVFNFSTTAGGAGGFTAIGISTLTGSTNTVSNNLVYNISSTGTTGGTAGTITGIAISNGTTNNLYNNKTYDLSTTSSGGTVNGILINSGTTNVIYNNIIGNLFATKSTLASAVNGINIAGGTTNNIYYNTVHLSGTSSGSGFGTSSIYVNATYNATLNNNIFNNASIPVGTGIAVAYRRSSTTLTTYTSSSNNNLFFAGAPCTNRLIFYDGTNRDQTLAAYKTRVAPRDAASISEEPPFLSTTGSDATFLHISTSVPTAIESGASTIAAVTTDFDGNTRGATPDIGADEFTGIANAPCSGTPTAGIATVSTPQFCNGGNTNICLTGNTTGTGISIQWQIATTASGPWTNVPCATGGTTTCYNTGALAAGVYYYQAVVTCANGGATGTSNVVTITSNVFPTITLTPNATSICNNGTGAAITASGASTYTWAAATGLSATTGATVTANPAATTTYTITGTSAEGCAGSNTVTVTVNKAPSISAIGATPNAICLGSTVNLNSTYSSNLGPVVELINEGFEGGTIPTSWAAINAGTGNNWTVPSTLSGSAHSGTKAAECKYHLTNAANAYLITSGVNLTAGKTYTISSWYRTSSSFDEKLKITVGTAQTAAAQTTVLQDLGIIRSATYLQQSITYTPSTSGTYYFGWNCYSIANQFYLEVDDILITEPAALPTVSWTSNPTGFTSTLQNPTGVTPTANTVYTLTVTNSNGCSATATTNVTLNNPVVTGAITEPTTCVTTTGAIDLIVTGVATDFTYAWSGTGVNATSQNQTGLGTATYNVIVTHTPSGCTTAKTFILDGPGGCNVCPTLPNANNAVASCTGSTITLSNTGLANMGVTYGIKYLYSTTALTDPYVGGTAITTVANSSLVAGTSSTANTSFATAGTYYVYAILSPTPINVTCRPYSLTTITVNTTPTVNPVGSQSVCNGSNTTAITFTGSVTGTTYSWTNSNPLIGLAANGIGNIPSFVATNTSTSASVGNITITPSSNGCVGTSTTASITVNPSPNATAFPNTQAICSGSNANIALTSSVSGTTFTWTRNNTTTVTGASSGTGNIATALTNTTNAAVTVTFTITPSANGCTGPTSTATVLVNPALTATTTPATQTICSGTGIANIVPTGNVVGSTFTWTRDNVTTVTGIASSGTGTISGVLTNTTNAAVTVTFTVTPSLSGCSGSTTTSTVIVNPVQAVSLANFTSLCKTASPFTLTGGTPSGGVYAVNGTTQTIFDPANYAAGVHTITYTITNPGGCPSIATKTIEVYAQPAKPVVTPSLGNYVYSSTTSNTYLWYINGNSIDNSNSNTYTPLIAAYYQVQVSNANGCKNFSDSLFYIPEKNRTNWLDEQLVYVYPNPVAAGEAVNIHFNLPTNKEVSYELYTEIGERLQKGVIPVGTRSFKLITSKYLRSNYVLKLTDSHNTTSVVRLQVLR